MSNYTNVKADIQNAKFVNEPTVPLTIGSYSFYIFLGGNATDKRNAIVVCTTGDCNPTSVSDEELNYLISIDSSIDGVENKGTGIVRSGTGFTANSATWTVTGWTVDNSSGDWTSATKGLLYYFDKKP